MISVIIPAHNEERVIARTLSSILSGAARNEFDVIVVCNACTDATASAARDFAPQVRVIETEIAGKPHALNLGDGASRGFPRIYADADIVISAAALRRLAQRLEPGEVLAVAPKAEYDLTGCSWPVRAYYATRSLLPSSREGIGGSGVYALSEAGRRRFEAFPAVVADDGYVRIQFQPNERETVTSAVSTVYPPRTIADLIATRTRAHYGSFQLERSYPELWARRGESNKKSLARLFANPALWPRLIIYCFVALTARHRAAQRLETGVKGWERDLSSRTAA